MRILRVVGVIRSLADDVVHECPNLLCLSFRYMFSFPLAAHAVYRVFSTFISPIVNLIWSLNAASLAHLRRVRKGVLKKS